MKFHERRFLCLDCEDTGFVTVFRPEVIERAWHDPDHTPWHRKCAVLCTCDAIQGKATHWKSGRALPVFGEQWWHIKATSETARIDAATVRPENSYVEWQP